MKGHQGSAVFGKVGAGGVFAHQRRDDQLRAALRLLFRGVKLAVEPADAASTAALCGPLRDKLAGKRVALIVSGANLDAQTFAALLTS